LAIAALTSAVSLLEVPVSYTMERWNWSRKRSVWILTLIIFLLSVPSAMSLGMYPELSFGGKALFDWIDFITSKSGESPYRVTMKRKHVPKRPAQILPSALKSPV